MKCWRRRPRILALWRAGSAWLPFRRPPDSDSNGKSPRQAYCSCYFSAISACCAAYGRPCSPAQTIKPRSTAPSPRTFSEHSCHINNITGAGIGPFIEQTWLDKAR